jgi:hypothetical protein
MKRTWVVGIIVGALAAYSGLSGAAEHGGQEHAGQASQEHGGKEHGGIAASRRSGTPMAHAEPSPEEIRQTIRDFIAQTEQEEGAFTIDDEMTGATRILALDRVHDRVGKTGDFYYSCTDMLDASTGELLDLDFDVEAAEGMLNVVDVRIHKVNGQPRYTYDDQDNRIPLM